MCLLDQALIAIGSFFVVSMQKKGNDPTQGENVFCCISLATTPQTFSIFNYTLTQE